MFTLQEVNSEWYQSVKPTITPPNWVFGPVWTTLYALIAVSLYLVWMSANKKQKKKIAAIYAINLVANTAWTLFYFGLHNPALALADILIVEATIILAIKYNWKINRKASWLLVPYLLWVSFATILNILSL